VPRISECREAPYGEIGVDRGGRIEREHVRHLGNIERRDHHLTQSLIQRTVVVSEHLHSREVRADDDQQQGDARQITVPRALERSLERGVGFEEERQLVDDEDARCRHVGRE